MSTEVYATFTVTGSNFDPADITAKVGVQPTKTWFQGDLISPTAKIRYQHNGWSLKSSLQGSDELGDHVKALLEQLQMGWQPLTEICADCEAEISCVIYTAGDRPAIHFDRVILDQLDQLNAAIDVDLYVVPEESLSSVSA